MPSTSVDLGCRHTQVPGASLTPHPPTPSPSLLSPPTKWRGSEVPSASQQGSGEAAFCPLEEGLQGDSGSCVSPAEAEKAAAARPPAQPFKLKRSGCLPPALGPGSLHRLTTPASRPKGLPLCLPPPLGLGLLPGPEWGHGRMMGYSGQEATGGQKKISAIPSQTGKAQRPGSGEQGSPSRVQRGWEEAGDGAPRVGLNNPALLGACEPRVRLP